EESAVAEQSYLAREGIPEKQAGDKSAAPLHAGVFPPTACPIAGDCLHLFEKNWNAWLVKYAGDKPAEHQAPSQNRSGRLDQQRLQDIERRPVNQTYTPSAKPATNVTQQRTTGFERLNRASDLLAWQ